MSLATSSEYRRYHLDRLVGVVHENGMCGLFCLDFIDSVMCNVSIAHWQEDHPVISIVFHFV